MEAALVRVVVREAILKVRDGGGDGGGGGIRGGGSEGGARAVAWRAPADSAALRRTSTAG